MNNSQFVLSYELLLLLQWIAEHDSSTIKKMIKTALPSGLQEELQLLDNIEDAEVLNDLQNSITDFLSLLETLLVEAVNEHIKEKARQKKLLPAVDQIDTSLCDNYTVRSSLEKATATLAENPNVNAKELLFKELLRRWKPNNTTLNN